MRHCFDFASLGLIAGLTAGTLSPTATHAETLVGNTADFQVRQNLLDPTDITAFRGSDPILEYGATGSSFTEDRIIFQFVLSDLVAEYESIDSAQITLVFESNPDVNNSTQSDLYGFEGNFTVFIDESDPGAADQFDNGQYAKLVSDFVPLADNDGPLAVDTFFTLDVTSFVADRYAEFKNDELGDTILFRLQVANQSGNRIRFYSADGPEAFRPTLNIGGTPIPEPASAALLTACALGLIRRRRPYQN